jgi:hypothetical protein
VIFRGYFSALLIFLKLISMQPIEIVISLFKNEMLSKFNSYPAYIVRLSIHAGIKVTIKTMQMIKKAS